jgi:putative ABC transport system permease protein
MRLGQLLQDANCGIRMLYRNRAFTGMAALSLIVGIAASTAAFSIFDGLFLNSLPYPDADRLVYLQERAPSWPTPDLGVSYVDLYNWRKLSSSFVDMAGFLEAGADLTGLGATARANIAYVTYNLPHTLGIHPILGREFLREEEEGHYDLPWKPGSSHHVTLLTYGVWQRWFGSARDVLGKTVHLDNIPYTVVGVLPPEAVYPADADVWVPLAYDVTAPGYAMEAIGRLRHGVTVSHAAADLARVHAHIPEARSHKSQLTFPLVTPLRQHYLGEYRTVSEMLLGAVGLLLLIACLNVSGLMMARGMARTRELAVRIALGAGRRRLTQQLLMESALLAAASAVMGMALGWAALRAMLSLMPDVLPSWVKFQLDARFLWFVVAVTVLTALLSSVAPALGALRTDARDVLADAGMKSSLSGGRGRKLNLLVIGEVAIALVLLVAGGLALEAFHRVTSRDPGFRADKVLTMAIDPPEGTSGQRFQICQELLTRLRSYPGVDIAGAIDYLPLGPGLMGRGDWVGWGIQPEGEAAERGSAAIRTVTPGYFRAMGVSLLAGRDFDARDQVEGNARVIVNQAFARAAWPGAADITGRRVRVQRPQWLTVIGVVHDVRHSGLEQPTRPEIFLAYSPDFWVPLTIVVRGKIDAEALAPLVRKAMRETDPSVAIFDAHTMRDTLDRSLWMRRAESWLFGAFAGIALLMAVAGIYGVVSYAVARRTREIGIRMALGAEPGQVVGQVLREGMLLVGIGLALGLAVAWYFTRLMGSLLAGLNPHEPRAYAAVILVLTSAALAANLLPARRAASVDPSKALRSD